jgi:hypothetical protein
MPHLDEHNVHVSIFDSGLLFAVDHHTERTTSDGDTLATNTASNSGCIFVKTRLDKSGGVTKDGCDFCTHLDYSFTKWLSD